MSQSAADDERPEQDHDRPGLDSEEAPAEDPEIEEDILQEELRIDGICGVY